MPLEIIWSEFAERQLDDISDYYTYKAGKGVSKKLVQDIIKEANKLASKPFIGQEESLLKDRKENYRYLVHKNYKVIYSVNENDGFVKIADVFDTRQNPIKIERSE